MNDKAKTYFDISRGKNMLSFECDYLAGARPKAQKKNQEAVDENHTAVRFATIRSTTEENLEELAKIL